MKIVGNFGLLMFMVGTLYLVILEYSGVLASWYLVAFFLGIGVASVGFTKTVHRFISKDHPRLWAYDDPIVRIWIFLFGVLALVAGLWIVIQTLFVN